MLKFIIVFETTCLCIQCNLLTYSQVTVFINKAKLQNPFQYSDNFWRYSVNHSIEHNIQKVKELRSKLTRDITLISIKLSTAVGHSQPVNTVDTFLSEVDSLFYKFLAVHLEYSYLLDSDSKFYCCRVVENLGMDDYRQRVQSTRNKVYKDMVSYKKTQYAKQARHIKRDIDRSLESIKYLSHKLESPSRNDSNGVNGLVQACFVEINSAILEVRRLIPDLRLVSEKINHGCTSEIERVEASIVAIKRKVIETKVLAITRIHQPTKRQTDKNLSNQLSDVSGVLTSRSYVYTHFHNANTSGEGKLTNTDGTGVQPQPSSVVPINKTLPLVKVNSVTVRAQLSLAALAVSS